MAQDDKQGLLIRRRFDRSDVGCFAIALGVFALLGLPNLQELLFTISARDGWVIERAAPDRITARPSTTRSFSLSPQITLWLAGNGLSDENAARADLPPAVVSSDYWSWPLNQAGMRIFWVNPKLHDAVEDVRFMATSLRKDDSPAIVDRAHEIAGAGFVYLGYAVRDMDDVRALAQAYRTTAEFDTSNDVTVGERTIYRLAPGVAEHFARNPSDPSEIAQVKASIPVIVERANAAAGHPMDTVQVLYLDGSIVELPFGERFPATQEFLDALFESVSDKDD